MDSNDRRGYNYSTRSEMPPNRHDNSPHAFSNGYSSDQLSDSNDEGPTYLLEHLATFTVGPPHGIQQPSDGLGRLLQMEKTSGIWTQKMQLRLEKKWIVIIDYENGDVVERFPMHLISDPTAFTNTELKDLYNNVLVFVVQEDPRKKNVNPAEMHIFQCVRVSAQEVVEDMKLFMSGKWKLGFGKSNNHHIPPPPNNPPPEPPVNGINVRQQVSRFNAVSSNSQHNEMHSSENSHPSPVSHNSRLVANRSSYRELADETSSTSSEKYEQDVTVLNCCFDDIERFIGRLQSAAAAYRELERRRRTRKGKKKDHGEGMLSMRAKPPPEPEFVDILQKFKLSFNLLAKLKSHIHDPNAPELVHFLFTPLALIMDASRDSNYGPNLASKIVSPLLTREAVDLLTNCLTSKESDLWHSLGDTWTVPRDQWKDYVPPYHPVFSSGFTPNYSDRTELETAAVAPVPHHARRGVFKVQNEPEFDYPHLAHNESQFGSNYYYNSERGDRPSPIPSGDRRQQHFDAPFDDGRGFVESRDHASSPHSDRAFSEHRGDGRSDISADSIERGPMDPQRQFDRHQRNWLEELKAQGAKIVQVTYPRTANNDKELTVFRGEYLEVLDDLRKWWKTRNARGQIAHVPHTIVTPYKPGDEDITYNNPLYGRHSQQDSVYGEESPNRSTDGSYVGDRPFRPLRTSPPAPPANWKRDNYQGKKETGYDNSGNGFDYSRSNEDFLNVPPISENKIPKPPKLPTSPTGPWQVMPKNLPLIPKTPNQRPLVTRPPITNITSDSTSADVMAWLRELGVSNRTIHALQGMDGNRLLSLTAHEINESIEKEDAVRINSKLHIIRNAVGFKTFRTKEFMDVLIRRKNQIDRAANSSHSRLSQSENDD